MLDSIMDKGENYIANIMKIIGIKQVQELKVDGTGKTEEERQEAISKANKKIKSIIDSTDF